MLTYSVVVPAHDAERSIARTLEALTAQEPPPVEVIVVDDASTDDTAGVARALGARVVSLAEPRRAGGARNAGRAALERDSDVLVYLDADVVPAPGWGAAVVRAAEEFPNALVGAGRTFTASSPWGWVAHLQVETPFLARGVPRETYFVSSFCMLVPRDADLAWEESYGGEDAFFCAAATAAGLRLVFDPRIVAAHEHERSTFADLRGQQRRFAIGHARAAGTPALGADRTLRARFPVHYFLLLRLPFIYRRVADDPVLRRRFLANLPRLALAEWLQGIEMIRQMHA